jgi:LysR family transcriptional regulator, nitrogen assimilation regulatory protein
VTLEVRQLQLFAAVFEEGGFSQAAIRQNSTQPAVSLQISRLETLLNVRLFERHARGAVPTESGRRLYAHALVILRDLSNAENDLGELRGAISGSLAVGLPQTLAQGVLDHVVDAYTKTFSGVRLRIVQASSGTLQSMILGKQLDLAVVTPLPRGGPLRVRRLYSDRMMLVSGPTRGLSNLQPCELSRIPDLKLIVPSPLHGTRGLIDEFLRSANVPVHQLLEIDGIAGMLNLVRATTWSALLPFIAVFRMLDDDKLVVSQISDGIIPMDYFLTYFSTATLSPAASAFIEVLEDALAKAKAKQSALMF